MAFKTDEANVDLFESASREVVREVTPLVDEIAEAVEALKAAEQVANDAKERLRGLAKARYWKENFQEGNPVHTFDAQGRDSVIQINFLNKYGLDKEKAAAVIKLLGQAQIGKMIEEHTYITFDVTSLDRKQLQGIIADLIEVRDAYEGVTAVVDDKYVVNENFHNARLALLPALNQAIDEIVPVQVHITT